MLATVVSILANTHPNFELIVVDQSDGDDTRQALAPCLPDARLRYLPTPKAQGLSRARNEGIRQARGAVIAMTDDDCETPPNWLEEVARLFREHPDVSIAFCNVEAGPHDPERGFIPSYERSENLLISRISDKNRARGIGAGMTLRREAVLALGGFDEMLGAGAVLNSCEDGDLVVRALLKGHHIYETCDISVLHHGFRTWFEGRSLTQRDWVGIGAAYSKPLRCGYWRFLRVPLYELFVVALWPFLRDLAKRKKPIGFRRVTNFCKGFCQGLRTPLDHNTLLFSAEKQSNWTRRFGNTVASLASSDSGVTK